MFGYSAFGASAELQLNCLLVGDSHVVEQCFLHFNVHADSLRSRQNVDSAVLEKA